MAGLAEILINYGFRVSGSDLNFNASCQRLSEIGAVVFSGHKKENLGDSVNLLVYSSAVNFTNPELQEAQRRGTPIIRRAEVLAELMRLSYGVAVAGSHGKTTTTSMIAAVLEYASLDPTVIIGGQVKSLGTGGKLGKGDFLVAETDESDRSFLMLKPSIAIVTNIDTEHLSAYSSFAELQKSFHDFVLAVPFYGLAVLCVDDPHVRDLAAEYKGRKVTYGLSPEANLRAVNIAHHAMSSDYDVYLEGKKILSLTLPMPGLHMVTNSLAAIAIGLELDLKVETIANALAEFSGVKRRLEVVAEVEGVTVINDYGHHPTEIRATLAALCAGRAERKGSIHVIFQPHRYSRTKDCFADFIDCFHDCDNLYLTDIYAAGELPVQGITGKILFNAVSHANKNYVDKVEETPEVVFSHIKDGDTVLFLGAGSIGVMHEILVNKLRTRKAA